jgi:hypothetical protein
VILTKVPATAAASDVTVVGRQVMLLIANPATLPAVTAVPIMPLIAKLPAAPASAAVPVMVKQTRNFHG